MRPMTARRVITTFLFGVRNVPAALYKAMGGFATNGVNMTKLESYQLGGSFNATEFYADIEGHPGFAQRAPGAGGTAVLLQQGDDARHLSGASLPRGNAVGSAPAQRGNRPRSGRRGAQHFCPHAAQGRKY